MNDRLASPVAETFAAPAPCAVIAVEAAAVAAAVDAPSPAADSPNDAVPVAVAMEAPVGGAHQGAAGGVLLGFAQGHG